MDPLVIFDCQKVVPNRFALVLAAAARTRALNRGAEPRLSETGVYGADLALREIAGPAFTPDELAPFLLAGAGSTQRLLRQASRDGRLRGDGSDASAAAPALLSRAAY